LEPPQYPTARQPACLPSSARRRRPISLMIIVEPCELGVRAGQYVAPSPNREKLLVPPLQTTSVQCHGLPASRSATPGRAASGSPRLGIPVDADESYGIVIIRSDHHLFLLNLGKPLVPRVQFEAPFLIIFLRFINEGSCREKLEWLKHF